jgi:hypothetical protein
MGFKTKTKNTWNWRNRITVKKLTLPLRCHGNLADRCNVKTVSAGAFRGVRFRELAGRTGGVETGRSLAEWQGQEGM